MGLGQYNRLGEYCDPDTASSVFLILLILLLTVKVIHKAGTVYVRTLKKQGFGVIMIFNIFYSCAGLPVGPNLVITT